MDICLKHNNCGQLKYFDNLLFKSANFQEGITQNYSFINQKKTTD
jgi:hypothetical protein